MLAGGAEAAIVPVGIAGFIACRAMSTNFNDTPLKASRPYDKDRDGFVMGEGAGCLVLEELEHAQKRGAKIYAEVIGYGLAGDAYHITAPADDGDGGYRAMEAAIGHAGIDPGRHRLHLARPRHLGAPLGDEIELGAVERLLGQAAGKTAMSSTKSSIGHLLGAAGAVEAAFTVLALRDQIAPPTINLDNPSVETALDLVPHKAKPMKIDLALSNGFGFAAAPTPRSSSRRRREPPGRGVGRTAPAPAPVAGSSPWRQRESPSPSRSWSRASPAPSSSSAQDLAARQGARRPRCCCGRAPASRRSARRTHPRRA